MTIWWLRNRRWLALIVPFLLLALAASSFRLLTLYLPWQWSRPTVSNATAGTLRQTYSGFDGQVRNREVRVEVVSLETHQRYGETKAPVGGVLWSVVLELEADPEQHLDGCEVELTDGEGTRFDFRSGLVPAEEGAFFPTPVLVPCVPEEAPGPTLDPLSGELIPSPITRPRVWQQQVLIAMPDDVTPTGLRIGWSRPEYLVLRLPG